jgi:predicted ATPase
MKLHFLEASVPLTKIYEKAQDGTIKKTPYPHVYEVSSHEEEVKSLAQFESTLKYHAQRNHCLLKGNLTRQLVKESRAGTTDANAATEWVCFDVDGLPVKTAEDFVKLLGLEDISYIVQYSASHGIDKTGFRAHIFMLLDKPTSAPLLKQWLIDLNHRVPVLHDNMGLTKTGNSISWPLDISACQNDKLIYIAPPVLKAPLKDPLGKTPRIALVRKDKERLVIRDTIASTAKNRERTLKRIEELREKDGLPKRKISFRMSGSMEVMVKPDVCTISEMKTERGFVYFNLNGGDSWAYYHPENNPDYIFNFKGEPVYLTKELLPEYWQSLTSAPARMTSQGIAYLAFCDRATGAYWRGTYDQGADALELFQAKNETQVRHFAKQHGVPLGDFIPEWDLVFDPHDNVRVDFQAKVVNTFELTPYMKAKARQVTSPPKTIMRVITHALGNDQATVDHFINWLAFILQKRDRTRTAWVLHGTHGTGKGVLMNLILRPLFGTKQTAARRMEEFNEQYNGFMRNAFIVFVDEVQTKALNNERGVMAKLKNFITEETVALRVMHQNATEVRNYTNWIFASNMADPVSIDKEDRRFNVGKYQPTPLKNIFTTKEMEDLEPTLAKELQAFHDYLLYYKMDEVKASSVLESEDRSHMIAISESSADTVASALLEGRFEFFMDQLPTSEAYKGNALEINRVEEYRRVLNDLLTRTDRNSGACNISRDELRTVFDYTVGGIPNTPNKFTTYLKHHRIHIGKVWLHGSTVNGLKLMWQDTDKWNTYLKTFAPAKTSAQPKRKLMAAK